MFVLGVGIGAVMQVLVIAVQNVVPYADLGVATSGATFFRFLGSWSADLDAQLASRIKQLTRDILDDPARRHQLLAALAPTPAGTP